MLTRWALWLKWMNGVVTEEVVGTEPWERMIAGGRLYMNHPQVRKELK